MFTTRAETVDYLVSQGKPRGLAIAAINETYNYEDVGDKRGLLFEANEETEDFEPCKINEVEAMQAYDTMCEMFEVTTQGIEVDGDLLYDLDGNKLTK